MKQVFKYWMLNVKVWVQLYCIGAIILIIVGAAGFIGITKLHNAQELSRLAVEANKIEVNVKNQVQEWKNILIRGQDPVAYEKYLTSMLRNDQLVNEGLAELSKNSAKLNENFSSLNEIKSLHQKMTESYLKGLELYDPNNNQSYKIVDDFVEGVDRKPVALLEELVKYLQAKTIAVDEHAIKLSMNLFIMAIVLTMLIIIIYARAIARIINDTVKVVVKVSDGYLKYQCPHDGKNELGQLSQEINEMTRSLRELTSKMYKASGKLSQSAANMATASNEQESTASEQATSTQEIVSSSQEITQTAKELLSNMNEVAKAVDNTAATAQEGREDLHKMKKILGNMVSSSKEISEKLSVLNEKTSNISMVVTTINKVADQTNLLSINAAIEADKAGEAGIGFATVASEIRRLSDQTAIATWDIEQLVKEIQTAVSSGVMGMEKFHDGITKGVGEITGVGEKLSEIVEQVGFIGPHFIAVHEGMESQTEGAEQISTGVFQLGETISDLLESIRFSNKSIDEVNREAKQLMTVCERFNNED